MTDRSRSGDIPRDISGGAPAADARRVPRRGAAARRLQGFVHASGRDEGAEHVERLAGTAVAALGGQGYALMMIEDLDASERRWMRYAGGAPSEAADANDPQALEHTAEEALRRGEAVVLDLEHTAESSVTPARAVASPVLINGKGAGALVVLLRRDAPRPEQEDIAIIDAIAWLVGQLVQATRLQAILSSRFAQLALAKETPAAVEAAVDLATTKPGHLARILAKSFYREMLKAGFTSGQIIDAASEIISQLSGNLKRHSDRWQRSGRPPTKRASE